MSGVGSRPTKDFCPVVLHPLVSFGRHRFRRLPLQGGLLLIPLILACFASMPQLRAGDEPDVTPPPDGSCPGGNTAEGNHALLSRTTGIFNAAFGSESTRTLTTASFNTGAGAGTLALNNADENTATGAGAFFA
jgi:hypothetical protein